MFYYNKVQSGPARGVFNVFQTHRRRRRRHSKKGAKRNMKRRSKGNEHSKILA